MPKNTHKPRSQGRPPGGAPAFSGAEAKFRHLSLPMDAEYPEDGFVHINHGSATTRAGTKRAEETKGLLDKLEAAGGERTDVQNLFLLTAREILSLQKNNLSQLNTLLWTVRPIRWVGWLFLAFAAIDIAEALYTVELMNPLSEMQTIQRLVDLVAVPLLGVVLVFWGGGFRRRPFELVLLKGLSWLSLFAGLLYLSLAPLNMLDAHRLDRLKVVKLDAAADDLVQKMDLARDKLQGIDSPRQFQAILAKLTQDPPALSSDISVEQLRERTLQVVNRIENQQMAAIDSERGDNRIKFWIASSKWSIRAALAGILFIGVWFITKWVRKAEYSIPRPWKKKHRKRRRRSSPTPAG